MLSLLLGVHFYRRQSGVSIDKGLERSTSLSKTLTRVLPLAEGQYPYFFTLYPKILRKWLVNKNRLSFGCLNIQGTGGRGFCTLNQIGLLVDIPFFDAGDAHLEPAAQFQKVSNQFR